MSYLTIIGMLIIGGFYIGKGAKFIKLPSIIGFMVAGVVFGPSLLGILDEHAQHSLSFITEIALSFVALTIGLELSFTSLKKQGWGIISIIFAESFFAFFVVTAMVYLITKNLPLSLIFGSIAPASAPAGTVAIIQEYKAKGSLTKALYAVVGFDDGLGIVIFGFASAFAKTMLENQTGGHAESFFMVVKEPLLEVVLSVVIGTIVALVFCLLSRRLNKNDNFILVFGTILFTTGLCSYLHLSLILTNMIVGLVIVNTQSTTFTHKLADGFKNIMPVLFVMFFGLAGANLHLSMLSKLGLIGLVYVLSRSFGLIVGSRIGAMIGNVEEKIKKYVGMGILSQAGVAIGLSLIVKNEFSGLGAVIDGGSMTSGDYIGTTVITTVTATCIFFELIGPVLTKIALTKANEIEKGK